MRKSPSFVYRTILVPSKELEREVTVSLVAPAEHEDFKGLPLLIINDGQDLESMQLTDILESLWKANRVAPLLIAGIHAGAGRVMEYGVTGFPDYLGRGAKAAQYREFIAKELLGALQLHWKIERFDHLSFAGFSLGGLSALDLSFDIRFSAKHVGVFSGALWWRSLDQAEKTYQDEVHRIMHRQIREAASVPSGLRFFFQCGALDELMDRNKNGVIDSIDDTKDLIKELVAKGYNGSEDIVYLEMPDGRHDISTWARALFPFFIWGWGT